MNPAVWRCDLKVLPLVPNHGVSVRPVGMDSRSTAFLELTDDLLVHVDVTGYVVWANGPWLEAGLPGPTQSLSEAVDSRDRYELERLLELSPGQVSSQAVRFVAYESSVRFAMRAKCTGAGIFLSARADDGRRRVPTDQPVLAGKLQSMGELAAGIAHEINTPIQFVGNNLEFLEHAFTDLLGALDASRQLASALGDSYPELTRRILKRNGVELLATEVPSALGESIQGVNRISEIVRAMNEFAHPQNDDQRLVDVHKIINTAVSMTQSAWKYHAVVDLDLADDLPLVPAYGGGLGQVMLNLLINATHAIEAAEPSGAKGSIRIRTSAGDDHIHIIVSDSGCGMSADVQNRIFDPFFTTKKAGKGTGQGLALAHREITERHGGTLDVVSAPGRGTEFHIGLPMSESSSMETGKTREKAS